MKIYDSTRNEYHALKEKSEASVFKMRKAMVEKLKQVRTCLSRQKEIVGRMMGSKSIVLNKASSKLLRK